MLYSSGFRCSCDRTKNNNESQEGPTPDASDAYVSSAESICTCGYVKTAHSKEAVGSALSSNTSRSWTVEEDTDTFPTNAHGKIEFDETEAHTPFNKPTIKRVGQSIPSLINRAHSFPRPAGFRGIWV